MIYIPTHSTFVSFDHDDYQQVNGFIGLKNFDNNFNFVNRKLDYMIQGTDASIASTIRENYLKQSVVTVVMVGSDTHNSDWVEREIKMTLRQKHGLLGILLKDTNPHTQDGKYYIPSTLKSCVDQEYATFIDWNPEIFKEEIHNAFLRSQQFSSYFGRDANF